LREAEKGSSMTESNGGNMENKIIPMSIVIPLRKKRSETLLGLKYPEAAIGANTRSPFGGIRQSIDRSDVDCAVRELSEETNMNVSPSELRLVGLINFNRPKLDINKVGRCHIYLFDWTEAQHGTPKNTAEMLDQQWYPVDALPFDEMLADCQVWLAEILMHHNRISGDFYFDPNGKLLYWNIESMGTVI
jgi:8-oxo-dGTP diphosphatase